MEPTIREVCQAEGVDPRFVAFLAEALRRAAPEGKSPRRHVRPSMLCDSLCELALERFGGLALYVLETWGIRTTRDVGEVIARLHEHRIFMFSEGEGVEDFDDLVDLNRALSVESALGENPET